MDVRGPLARHALAAVALAAALTPATVAHAATLSVEHSAFTATEVGAGADGVRAPGAQLDVTESVISAELPVISNVTGTLSAPLGGVNILAGSSAWEDLTFGVGAANLSPFRVHIPTSADCGAPLRLSVHLASGVNTADVPLTIPTGVPGESFNAESSDVPHAVPNPGVLTSDLPVTTVGRVKDLRVRIGQLDHTYDQDLRISLISPSGTRVVLVDGQGSSGDDFTNTTFAAQGAFPASGTAPFSGTFRAEGDLAKLDGEPMQGTWKLEIVDSVPSDAGLLRSWGLDLVPASCIARPAAAFAATPQPALPGQNVTLDASTSTDPTGTITHYEWDLDGDGTFETDGGSSPVLVHAFATRGAYDVGLRITDDHGDSDTVNRSISITTPPVASFTASPVQPLSGADVTLDGSASHPGDTGTIVRWEWDLDGNGTFELDTGALSSTTTRFLTPGPHETRLRVTDDTGATAVAVKSVVVDNRPPTADLTVPTPVVAGSPVVLDASGSSDPDGTVDTYAFDLDGDGVYETNQGPTATAQTTFLTSGSFTVGVEVTDSSGATDTKTLSVPVTAAPVAAIVPSALTLRPHQSVTFDASGSSDADGTIANYRFDLDGNGSYETDTGSTATTSTSFAALGAHTVRVRVTDNAGATATASVIVTVVDLAPIAVLSAGPNPAPAGTPVIFDAGPSSDPDGSVARYEWDLDGNGTFERDTQGTSTLTFAYPNPGAYTARLRVTDNDGVSSTTSLPIVVTVPTGTGTGGGTTGGGGTGTGGGYPSGGGTGTGGGTGGGTGTGGGALPGDTQLNAGLTGAPMQKLKSVLKKGIAVSCAADRPVRCILVAEVGPSDAKRLKLVKAPKGKPAKSYRVGKKAVTAVRGADGVARFKLPAKLKGVLKKQRSLLVVVRGTAIDGQGRRATLTRAVLLRR
jgi:subtilisin-like proprotein convertase family protein